MNSKNQKKEIFNLTKKHYIDIEKRITKKFERSLPFQKSIMDHFERAKMLNFREDIYIYNSFFDFGEKIKLLLNIQIKKISSCVEYLVT